MLPAGLSIASLEWPIQLFFKGRKQETLDDRQRHALKVSMVIVIYLGIGDHASQTGLELAVQVRVS